MKKIDIHVYLKNQGFDVSYSTVKRVTQYLETKHQEAFIRQEYEPGDICEFAWGTVKLNIGNEKGHVERSVEYIRRKVFSGPECDKFDTLVEANKFLYRVCMKLNSKAIYDHSIPAETFKTEKQFLLPAMPRFESCIKSTAKVDKYATVMVSKNHYSVPDIYVGKTVDIRLYRDKVII